MIALAVRIAAAARQWPFRLDGGPAWEIDNRGGRADLFFLDGPAGERVFSILSRWPVKGGSEQVPASTRTMARNLDERFAGKPLSYLVKDGYDLEGMTGAERAGRAAVLYWRHGTVQAIFMASDGGGLWNGRLSGSRLTLTEEARRVLAVRRRPLGQSPDWQAVPQTSDNHDCRDATGCGV